MARIDYDRTVAQGFEQSRALPLDALTLWREAIAPYFDAMQQPRVLDVGSGTGAFAIAFAEWFDARVAGIEPSAEMRREAARVRSDPRIAYTGGEATHLPLKDATCDAAWLSTVIHHISDLPVCARELRRVLRPGAPVLIRSAFPGRLDGITLFQWFPSAAAVAETFPSIEKTVAAFAAGGFSLERIESVPQTSSPGLRAFADRARLRADTTLRLMPDDDYVAGLTRLEAAAAAEKEPAPIIDRLDLLVLR